MYFNFSLNIKVTFGIRPSYVTPFCSSRNGLLTSLPVASVSYHNCSDRPVTFHVIAQRYCQYYILVTSLFRVFLCDLKQLYQTKSCRDCVFDFQNLSYYMFRLQICRDQLLDS